MQPSQRYVLTINDLFTKPGGVLCGVETEVAILDGDVEIDRLQYSGKVGPGGDGYRRSYTGKTGLSAKIVSGPGSINFQAVEVADLTPAA
ncbi:hypothetical protein [Pseudomonas sp. ZS1P83]